MYINRHQCYKLGFVPVLQTLLLGVYMVFIRHERYTNISQISINIKYNNIAQALVSLHTQSFIIYSLTHSFIHFPLQ